jgi:uncharacterized membrane protein
MLRPSIRPTISRFRKNLVKPYYPPGSLGNNTMRCFLAVAAALHALFMVAELFPWSLPFLLKRASRKLPPVDAKFPDDKFSEEQRKIVVAIVHNAAIYNGIICGGLLWAAFAGSQGHDVARVMLLGATAAGIFGAVTLRNPVPALQAAVGIAGLFII